MMKKFIIKSTFFVAPFFIFYFLNLFFYSNAEGDLARLGYLYSNPLPKSEIDKSYSIDKKFTSIKELGLNQSNQFDLITIGDSFSEEGNLGYKNFIANQDISVLHIDRSISGNNPVKTLLGLANSNFFNQIKTKYLLLQTVERDFITRCSYLDFEDKLSMQQLQKAINKSITEIQKPDIRFFSDVTVKAPLVNFLYNFDHLPLYSQTFRFSTDSKHLYSIPVESLLFYKKDITTLKIKNDTSKITKSVNAINAISALLKKKNISLIFMISPDKYDLYYPYIKENSQLRKSNFFTIYNKLKKSYIDIATYEILINKIKEDHNIYYYDDTHWTPKAASLLANEVISKMKENNSEHLLFSQE